MVKSCHFLFFLSACFGVLSGQSFNPDSLKSQQLLLRETINNNRKVYVRVKDHQAYYIHEKSRLFPVRRAEPITVRDVSQKGDHTEVVFVSRNLGKGKIRIYRATTAELFDAAIRSAFAPATDEARVELVLNRKTSFIHFAGSNHIPGGQDGESIGLDGLRSGNYRKCPLCFQNVPRVSGYDLEIRLGEGVTEQIHARYPLVTDDQIQRPREENW